MNDPGPYRTAFSDLASSEANQDAFFESLITFMQRHDFDGVDLDWEYPAADDRGGIPEDFDNLVTLLRRLRARLNQTGRKYGLALTLVSRGASSSPYPKVPFIDICFLAGFLLVPSRIQHC
jgi:chitinase